MCACSLSLFSRSVYVHQDKPQLAQAALEQAVSANFAVSGHAWNPTVAP